LNADAANLGGLKPADLESLGIGLLSSGTDVADAAESLLRRRYRFADESSAETLVALGGDGFMLQTLHRMLEEGCTKPVFGMNRGTVGFLMNDWRIDQLPERIAAAKAINPRSEFGFPTICMATGIPRPSKPTGTATAGNPNRFTKRAHALSW